nr:MAG TPA: hypothetical protein [Caudoviricetes sp.]
MSQLAALFLEVADTSFFYFGKGGAVWQILIIFK